MLKKLFPDLTGYSPRSFGTDTLSATAITFLAVPQGVAYAMIAGLPPATGLFAGALPLIFSAFVRSSPHVIAGPTNALSLLVGSAIAANTTDDPVAAALVLAAMVGIFQMGAGLLRLGSVVDYISSAVVAGYITGAGILIGVGQLKNLTGTPADHGNVYTQISSWIAGIEGVNYITLALGLGTTLAILCLRQINRFLPGNARVPSAIIVLSGGILLSWALDLDALGVAITSSIAPTPVGIPPVAIPNITDVGLVQSLLPLAVAATVLSLVESSAVARSNAAKTGFQLQSDREFFGQGLANLVSGFSGGYPISGSLSRSAIHARTPGTTRVGGVLAGLMMLAVLMVLGPIVDLTPVASLAGLLMVLAVDLVDFPKIKAILAGDLGDKTAFTATMLGTWILPLDQAIYLGVGISLVLFLRRARQLVVRTMYVDGFRVRESDGTDPTDSPIRILHVEGSLFFGAANELYHALDSVVADERVQVLILRIKRTRGLDYTTATTIESIENRLSSQGRTLYLVGMNAEAMRLLERVGIADSVGRENLYPSRMEWFGAMDQAIADAAQEVGNACPEAITSYLSRRSVTAQPSSDPQA